MNHLFTSPSYQPDCQNSNFPTAFLDSDPDPFTFKSGFQNEPIPELAACPLWLVRTIWVQKAACTRTRLGASRFACIARLASPRAMNTMENSTWRVPAADIFAARVILAILILLGLSSTCEAQGGGVGLGSLEDLTLKLVDLNAQRLAGTQSNDSQ